MGKQKTQAKSLKVKKVTAKARNAPKNKEKEKSKSIADAVLAIIKRTSGYHASTPQIKRHLQATMKDIKLLLLESQKNNLIGFCEPNFWFLNARLLPISGLDPTRPIVGTWFADRYSQRVVLPMTTNVHMLQFLRNFQPRLIEFEPKTKERKQYVTEFIQMNESEYVSKCQLLDPFPQIDGSYKIGFHGTKHLKDAMNILRHGFDPKRRGKNGQVFGPGEYFARQIVDTFLYGNYIVVALLKNPTHIKFCAMYVCTHSEDAIPVGLIHRFDLP